MERREKILRPHCKDRMLRKENFREKAMTLLAIKNMRVDL